jgi:hypothetical protein
MLDVGNDTDGREEKYLEIKPKLSSVKTQKYIQ